MGQFLILPRLAQTCLGRCWVLWTSPSQCPDECWCSTGGECAAFAMEGDKDEAPYLQSSWSCCGASLRGIKHGALFEFPSSDKDSSSKVGIEVASRLADNAVEWCLQSKEQRIQGQSHRRGANSVISYAENHLFYYRTQWKERWNSRISNWEALEVEQPSKFKLCFSHIHVIDATLSRLSLFSENDTYLPISMYTKHGILVTLSFSATVSTSTMLCQSKYIFLSFWKNWRKYESIVFCFIEKNN